MVYICMRTRKTPPHTHTKRERDGEKGRGTNKVFVSDACDIIEDCQRERERERESGRGGGGVLCIKDSYKPCFDINLHSNI